MNKEQTLIGHDMAHLLPYYLVDWRRKIVLSLEHYKTKQDKKNCYI